MAAKRTQHVKPRDAEVREPRRLLEARGFAPLTGPQPSDTPQATARADGGSLDFSFAEHASAVGTVQRAQGDKHSGEVRKRPSDGVVAIYVEDQVRPWFTVPDSASVSEGDTVTFTEGSDRAVTELVVTGQVEVESSESEVEEPDDHSGSISLSSVTIDHVGSRYNKHADWDDTKDYLGSYTSTITKTSRLSNDGNSWVYSVPMGNGLGDDGPLYGQVLFIYDSESTTIYVFHAHGTEDEPKKMG